MSKLTVYDLARRYVDKIPAAISGGGGHNQTFTVACALIKGFDLSVDEARAILSEYNTRCDPPWSPAELEHKLKSADRANDDQPRGWLRLPDDGSAPRESSPAPAPERKPEFRDDKLKAFAARWRTFVDTAWLADRSVVDPFGVTPDAFLRSLFCDGEKVLIFTAQESQGQALWPGQTIPAVGNAGVWFLCQPVDGKEHPNPRVLDEIGKPKLSRRSEESITAWRYLVIESDEADPRDWMGAIVQLPLRIAAIYTSGGRSIHALVRVDAPSNNEWKHMAAGMKPVLVTLGADPKAMTSVRLTRLPGCRRGRSLQKLLYLNPDPGAVPICSRPRQRDVLAALARWVEGVEKMEAEEMHGSGFQGFLNALKWYESAPAARAMIERVAAAKAGRRETPTAGTPATAAAARAAEAKFVVRQAATGMFLIQERGDETDQWVRERESASAFTASRIAELMKKYELAGDRHEVIPA